MALPRNTAVTPPACQPLYLVMGTRIVAFGLLALSISGACAQELPPDRKELDTLGAELGSSNWKRAERAYDKLSEFVRQGSPQATVDAQAQVPQIVKGLVRFVDRSEPGRSQLSGYVPQMAAKAPDVMAALVTKLAVAEKDHGRSRGRLPRDFAAWRNFITEVRASIFESSGSHDGCLKQFEAYLEGSDAALRRAAATVLGYGWNSDLQTTDGQSPGLRSQTELLVRYVADQDADTADAASDALVRLTGGSFPEIMKDLTPTLLTDLHSARPPQSRGIARVFAFTSVPLEGVMPDLDRLFHSGDRETSLLALAAIQRSETVQPEIADSFFLVKLASTDSNERHKAIRDMERLGVVLWGYSLAPEMEPLLRDEAYQTAWARASTGVHVDRGQVHELRWQLLTALEFGLRTPGLHLQVSSAKALVPIAQQVAHYQLPMDDPARTDQKRVLDVLSEAARSVRGEDPSLAHQLVALSERIAHSVGS